MARTLSAIFLLTVLSLAPGAAGARDRGEPPRHNAYSGLVGVGAALGTLVYAPLKIGYALSGTLLSGMAWAWTAGDGDIATSIVRSAVRGDYVVRPAHVEGDEKLAFLGKRY